MNIEKMYETIENHIQFHALKNSGMLWELFPDCPEYWAAYKDGRDKWLEKEWKRIENY